MPEKLNNVLNWCKKPLSWTGKEFATAVIKTMGTATGLGLVAGLIKYWDNVKSWLQQLGPWLSKTHDLSLAGRVWLLLFAAVAGIPVCILLIIQAIQRFKRRTKPLPSDPTDKEPLLLMGETAVANAIKRFFETYVEQRLPISLTYRKIDVLCSFKTGEAKKFFAKMRQAVLSKAPHLASIKDDGTWLTFGEGLIRLSAEQVRFEAQSNPEEPAGSSEPSPKLFDHPLDAVALIIDFLKSEDLAPDGTLYRYDDLDDACDLEGGKAKSVCNSLPIKQFLKETDIYVLSKSPNTITFSRQRPVIV